MRLCELIQTSPGLQPVGQRIKRRGREKVLIKLIMTTTAAITRPQVYRGLPLCQVLLQVSPSGLFIPPCPDWVTWPFLAAGEAKKREQRWGGLVNML